MGSPATPRLASFLSPARPRLSPRYKFSRISFSMMGMGHLSTKPTTLQMRTWPLEWNGPFEKMAKAFATAENLKRKV